jgi:hypothetical protein
MQIFNYLLCLGAKLYRYIYIYIKGKISIKAHKDFEKYKFNYPFDKYLVLQLNIVIIFINSKS